MNIYGNIILLRAIEMEDSELIRGMFNDPEMEKLVVGWSFPLSKYSQNKWLEENYKSQDLRFVIETIDEHEAVGIATLTNIDWKNRHAFHGMKLANVKQRHKGIGTDTVMAIMRYAFDELQLHRLDGSWLQDNMASKAMYQKCGWKEEGVQEEYIFKNGKYHDLVISRILKKEYEQIVVEKKYWNK